MSSEVATAAENQPAEADNANNQPRNNFWTMMKGFFFRMMIIYFISSFFRRSPAPESSQPGGRSPVTVLSGINIYQKGTWFDLYVYTSDMYNFNDFNNNSSLFWHLKNIEYGDWNAGPNSDGTFQTYSFINPTEVCC